jgi:hypothetical protein
MRNDVPTTGRSMGNDRAMRHARSRFRRVPDFDVVLAGHGRRSHREQQSAQAQKSKHVLSLCSIARIATATAAQRNPMQDTVHPYRFLRNPMIVAPNSLRSGHDAKE